MNNDLMSKKDFLDLFYVASAGQDKAFIEAVEMVVADTPAVDAVEVVRCKDCIHCGFCGRDTNLEVMGFYGYCSRGERREDG